MHNNELKPTMEMILASIDDMTKAVLRMADGTEPTDPYAIAESLTALRYGLTIMATQVGIAVDDNDAGEREQKSS